MNRTELESLCQRLFGYGWKSRLAEVLEINRKSVSRWIAADAVPAWAAERVRELAGRPALAPIPGPPPGTSALDDRDDACAEALRPAVEALLDTAERAGWSRAEALVAVLSWTTTCLREIAGDSATRQTLESAILLLDE